MTVDTKIPFPSTVILVPFRPATDRHHWLWDMILPHLESFGWPIYTGSCDGPWRRAAAVNDAARKAGDWGTALIADCDTIPDHDGILRAVEWVRSTGGGCRPHDQRYMLSQQQTVTAVQRGVHALPVKTLRAPWAGGGLDVVTRDAWDVVGGMDESYEGWGYEDSEFHVQMVVKSRWDRLPGHAWHLWHPTDANKPARESVLRYRETQRRHRAELDAWCATKGLARAMQVF